MNEDRLIELESKISHQEFTIEKLNQLVREQEMIIYQLDSKVSVLDKKFKEIEGLGNETGPANQKPPHY